MDSTSKVYQKKLLAKLRNKTPLTAKERQYLLKYLKKRSKLTVVVQLKDSSTQTCVNSTSTGEEELLRYLVDQYELGCDMDEANVKIIMDITYARRRCMVMAPSPVEAVLEKYPILCVKEQLILEFCRIKVIDNIMETFQGNVDKYCSPIWSCSTTTSTKRFSSALLDNVENEKEKNYIRNASSLMMLPTLLNEDIGTIMNFSSKEPKSLSPTIVCTQRKGKEIFSNPTKFRIFADQKLVVESTNFLESILLFCACHYCFDRKYNNAFIQTSIVLEKLYLELPTHDVKPTERVLEITQMLEEL